MISSSIFAVASQDADIKLSKYHNTTPRTDSTPKLFDSRRTSHPHTLASPQQPDLESLHNSAVHPARGSYQKSSSGEAATSWVQQA